MNDGFVDDANMTDSGTEVARNIGRFDAAAVHHLGGMYRNWFLDYASSVILDRAVPHIEDGLKPVQRRILHTMYLMDDGRLNKVANIVGSTMKFHPHGDASIGDALVQIGQKDLLVDTQGNWGNILTGSEAAAPRYIEARLSKFALEVVFNPKTTEWQMSYDGRNREPITLPVKFPLLLAQGTEGIAVGLSTKILPHNFCELCDAAASSLRGEPFMLYPDFPTGGSIDVARYNDGERGGQLKVRAKIEKLDGKTLVIRELPFSKTSESLINSITKAIEKGQIKARKVEDLTAAEVEIQIHLASGISPDKTIDALYAFTDCEISLSPNCCVIENNKPKFTTVSDMLRHSAMQTKQLIGRELEIRRNELLESLHFASLESIFIEERIYKGRPFENAATMDAACEYVDERLTPFYPQMIREVTKDDILRLMEIKMQRILKFNKDKAEAAMQRMRDEIKSIEYDLAHLTDVTVKWFEHIKAKYGKGRERLTELRNFETIVAAKVAEANYKLYINRQEGFVGTGLKKDEFVCNCSDLDDIIIFYRDGRYKVTRVAEKLFVGKNVKHVQVWKRNDKRTIYNVVYRDGKQGTCYIKRFTVESIQRDKEYDMTMGTPGSRVLYFTANANGEAEVIKITLDNSHAKNGKSNVYMERSFADVLVKGRNSKGNILTKKPVSRIDLKSHGHSTLGGRKVWFDTDVNRLNYEERGTYLGEFSDNEAILVVLKNGEFYLSNIDVNNHYEDTIDRIEKWDENKVWTAVLYDADNDNYPYVKRFCMEASKRHQNMLGENPNSQLLILTDVVYPRLQVTFKGEDADRPALEIDVDSFIGVKRFKAKGKRITTFDVDTIEELEPTRFPDPEPEPVNEPEDDNSQDPEADLESEDTANTQAEDTDGNDETPTPQESADEPENNNNKKNDGNAVQTTLDF
ncbi:MAG: DNA gyrase/topoisomerase IV subunit A [Prevotella sp.]|nr:DNA gyrase/topoisomerase IV subunit A [Prevotella sp.]